MTITNKQMAFKQLKMYVLLFSCGHTYIIDGMKCTKDVYVINLCNFHNCFRSRTIEEDVDNDVENLITSIRNSKTVKRYCFVYYKFAC